MNDESITSMSVAEILNEAEGLCLAASRLKGRYRLVELIRSLSKRAAAAPQEATAATWKDYRDSKEEKGDWSPPPRYFTQSGVHSFGTGFPIFDRQLHSAGFCLGVFFDEQLAREVAEWLNTREKQP